MKILEKIVDILIQQVMSIDDTSRALTQEEHYRCNLCGAANAGEMPYSKQINFYGLPGNREAFNSAPGNLYSESCESYVAQGVNTNALSHICVVYNYSQENRMNGGVRHWPVLSTLLVILIIWCRESIDSRLESSIKAGGGSFLLLPE